MSFETLREENDKAVDEFVNKMYNLACNLTHQLELNGLVGVKLPGNYVLGRGDNYHLLRKGEDLLDKESASFETYEAFHRDVSKGLIQKLKTFVAKRTKQLSDKIKDIPTEVSLHD